MSGFLCSGGCTLQSQVCWIGSLVCMQRSQRSGGSRPQNPFLNECLCSIHSCYCCKMDSNYGFREILSYDQNVIICHILVTRYWSLISAATFANRTITVTGCNSAFKVLQQSPFSAWATRTVVEFYRVSY